MRCPPTSTDDSVRRCGQRSTVVARTPRLPVSATRMEATVSTSAGSQSADTTCAGRPFFITIGVAQASNAPAPMSAPIVWAITSPETSSTLTSTCTAVASRSRRDGRRLRCRADDHLHDVGPAGGVGTSGADSRPPTPSSPAEAPNEVARATRAATPVGVASSRSVSIPTTGTLALGEESGHGRRRVRAASRGRS